MALVQDAFELGNAVCARPLEGNLVRDANDLHGSWIAGYFAVGDRHHVIQTQRLSWRQEAAKKTIVLVFI